MGILRISWLLGNSQEQAYSQAGSVVHIAGSYAYTNTGADTGELTANLRRSGAGLGIRCTVRTDVYVDDHGHFEVTSGVRTATTDHEEKDWRLSDLSTPVYAGTVADTIYFVFLDTWQAGQNQGL